MIAPDGGREEVCVGLVVASAHASAQLMELREPELVGAFDQNRVGARHVDPRLDDGGAEKDVVALLIELAHDAFEFALVQLSVRDRDARFGDELRKVLAAVFDRLHFVVKEVHLTAALQFADHGFADEAVLFGLHEGLHRQTALGRRRDDREIADPFEAHRERARNRGGREREDVDLGAEFFQLFLLPHAETVFFVDHDEAEARKGHPVAQKLVRADHDVDRALGNAFERARRFLSRAEARKFRHANGPGRKAVLEGLGVLFGQRSSDREPPPVCRPSRP